MFAILDTIRAIPNIELIVISGSAVIALLMVIVGVATSAPNKEVH